MTGIKAQGQKTNRSTSGLVIYTSKTILGANGVIILTDTLKFNRQKSFFQWQRKQKTLTTTKTTKGGPPKTTTKKVWPPDTVGRYNLFFAANDSLYTRKRFSKQPYLIKEKPRIKWTITDSTKKTEQYTLTMAKTHFRGRDYIAWFSPKIPLPYGPWKSSGLPGLIIKIHDTKKKIFFNAKKIQFKDNISIGQPPLAGNEIIINLDEYKELMIHRNERAERAARKKVIRSARKKSAAKNTTVHVNSVSVTLAEPMEIFPASTGQ